MTKPRKPALKPHIKLPSVEAPETRFRTFNAPDAKEGDVCPECWCQLFPFTSEDYRDAAEQKANPSTPEQRTVLSCACSTGDDLAYFGPKVQTLDSATIPQVSDETSPSRDLLEAVADLAMCMQEDWQRGDLEGELNDDSRARVGTTIDWALEFDKLHADTNWDDGSYMEVIEDFYAEKVKGHRKNSRFRAEAAAAATATGAAPATVVIQILGDQPTTCPKCGARTDFTENPDRSQKHTCLGCGHTFVAEAESEAERLLADVQEAQTAFWDALHDLEAATGLDIDDSSIDFEGYSLDDLREKFGGDGENDEDSEGDETTE